MSFVTQFWVVKRSRWGKLVIGRFFLEGETSITCNLQINALFFFILARKECRDVLVKTIGLWPEFHI